MRVQGAEGDERDHGGTIPRDVKQVMSHRVSAGPIDFRPEVEAMEISLSMNCGGIAGNGVPMNS